MTVISKELFYDVLKPNLGCDAIHYWNKNCMEANLFVLRHVLWGSFKFFLPIYIVKTLLYYKKINWKLLKQNMFGLLRSAVYGQFFGFFVLGTVCLACKITGRLHYYNIGFLPGFVSGLSCLIESKENQLLDVLIFFNLVLESLLKNLDFNGIFQMTTKRQLGMFMMVSACLMYFLENKNHLKSVTHFWFYVPHQSRRREDKICNNSENYLKYTLDGFKKYFMLGYTINIIKKLLPKMDVLFKKPKALLGILFNKSNFKFALFIGGYVGVYRYVTSYLLKNMEFLPVSFYGAVAGMLAGATFVISPNTQVLIIAITTLLQVFYMKLSRKFNVKDSKIARQLLFMTCNGILFQNSLMCTATCPSYYLNMLKSCSNGWLTKAFNHLIKTYLGSARD